MRTDGTAGRNPIPVTAKGFACLACGLLFLADGILRGELAAALCGAVFSGFFSFCFFTAAISCLRWRSARLSIDWEQDKTKGLHVTCHHPRWNRSRIALVRVSCGLRYDTGTGQTFNLEVPLEGKKTFFKPRLPPRGVYSAGQPDVIIGDYPGFFRFRLREKGTDASETLIVLPSPEVAESVSWPAGKTGAVRGRSVFKRSDELFDSRPYRVGDDPRKIHWKQYAHTSALAVRQGDLLPPPASEFLFIVNAETGASIDAPERRRFSALMDRLAWTVQKLLGDGKIVSVGIGSGDGKMHIVTAHPDDPDGRHKLFAALARPQLNDSGMMALPSAFDAAGVTTVLVTMPLVSADASEGRLPVACDLVLTGPRIIAPRSFSAARLLRALFFSSEPLRRERGAALFSARLSSFVESLRAEGIHAETL